MVQVRMFGMARFQSGVKSFECDAKTVNELMNQVPNMKRRDVRDLVILVNGKSVSKRYRFKEGDEVVLMSPIGGG